ncbi:hypothetical protein D3C83_278450 [compost metagenome]
MISRFVSASSIRRARIISLSLRVTEYSLPRRMFLATCCVIVEPPTARLPEPILVT